MMRMNPAGEKEPAAGAKKESADKPEFPRISSRQWCSSFKNPRIVRVSRSFGGKDRHSKVCTVRGLRDRRIRLSVPTAIQLYDLQDKLGLSQPSKVVDWLIDASKQEIDKLPPLPMIPSHLMPNSHMDERESNHEEGFGGFVAHNLFPLPNMPYNNNNNSNNPNFFHWDPNPSNLSLSQFQTQESSYLSPITPPACYIPQPQNLESDYFRNISQLQQNSVLFPTTLHLIGRSHEIEARKQDK